MMRRYGLSLWLLLPLGAVMVFAALLGLALMRMSGIESDMRIGAERNMLWVTHQSEIAARRLAETALLARMGLADNKALHLRYDILNSRLRLMNDGPQRRFVEGAGLGQDMDRLRAGLAQAAPEMAGHGVGDMSRLHHALVPLSDFLGRAANMAMIAEWDDLGGRLETYRDQLRQIIIWLIGTMVAGSALVVMLAVVLRQSDRRNRMLAQARDFSTLLISSSGEGILAVDRQGQCNLWNHALTTLLGLSGGLMAGRRLTDLAGFFSTQVVQQGLSDAFAGRSTHLALQPFFRQGAEAPHYIDLRIFPMRDGGRIIGAILFIQDASDRHAARQQAEADRLHLETLVAARTRQLDEALRRESSAADLYRNFAALISHQFRTPLAVADSALQRLIRRSTRAEPDELRTRATRAREAITGLTRLLDSTLNASRPANRPCSTCDLSGIVYDLCVQRPDWQPGRIAITGLGCAIALGDPVHIEQVLENLLSNAVKYTSSDSVVSLHLHQDDSRMICDIHNLGPSLPDHCHDRLFERGFRGDNSDTSPGTGTGLFIARALARMQGGDVTLLPVAEGVTFRLALLRPAADLNA